MTSAALFCWQDCFVFGFFLRQFHVLYDLSTSLADLKLAMQTLQGFTTPKGWEPGLCGC